MRILLAVLVLICIPLTGCSTIYRTVSVDSKPATSINIDAKARMILVTDQGGEKADRRVICAEPSPDSVVGLASSASLAAKVDPKIEAKIAASLAEAVQSIGRRTQTIQLLRDGLYRACEAYLNGAISKQEYRILLARISAFSITMVAVDGLSGGQGIHSTSITTNSEATAGPDSAGASTGATPAAAAAAQPGVSAGAKAGGAQPAAGDTTLPAANVAAVVEIVKAFYEHQRYMNDHPAVKEAEDTNANQASASQDPAKK